MKRRGSGDGVPAHLMSLPKWIEEGHSPDPGPEPAWWPGDMPYRVYRARIDWSRERIGWAQQRRSLDAVNALFDPDLGYDPGPWEEDPRRAAQRDRRLIEALAPPAVRRD